MKKDLHIGADFFSALGKHAQAVSHAAYQAAIEGMSELESSARSIAKQNPAWGDAADHIETWYDPDDSQVYVGVRNPQYVDKAIFAEYGKDEVPPAPVLRHMPAAKANMNARINQVMVDHLGPKAGL
jgi:hypothetical protein